MAKTGLEDPEPVLRDLRSLMERDSVPRDDVVGNVVVAQLLFAVAGIATGAMITAVVLGAPPWPRIGDWNTELTKMEGSILWASYFGLVLIWLTLGLASTVYFVRKAKLARHNPRVRVADVIASLVSEYRDTERAIQIALHPDGEPLWPN